MNSKVFWQQPAIPYEPPAPSVPVSALCTIKRRFHALEPRYYYQRIGVVWHRMDRAAVAAEFRFGGAGTSPHASELGYCLRRDPGFIQIIGQRSPQGILEYGFEETNLLWYRVAARVPVELPAGSKWCMPLSMGAIHAR